MTTERQFDSAPTMSALDDIVSAVTALPSDQLAKFRVWFEEFDAARFDQKIERDAKAGRLDRLADQALGDFRAGRVRTVRHFPSPTCWGLWVHGVVGHGGRLSVGEQKADWRASPRS